MTVATPIAPDAQPRRPREAWQFLKIGRSLFWKLVRRGEIRVIKIGNKAYVPAGELLRVANEGTARPAKRGGRRKARRAVRAT